MRHARRSAGLLAASALLLLTVLSAPAAAHGDAAAASNYRSHISRQPDVDGVTWRVLGGGEYLTVSNSTAQEVVVLGYEGEPYLRVGPDGTFENVASPASTPVSGGRVELPGDRRQQPPRWRQVSEASSHAWHDERIVADGYLKQAAVADPGEATTVATWQVPFRLGDRQLAVVGELRWVPPPSPLAWLLVALLLVMPALLGLALRGGVDPTRRLLRPAAAVLAAVVTLDLTHVVDALAALPLPSETKAVAAAQATLFVAIGAFGALRAWQGRDGAFTALGVGAASLLVGDGLLHLSALTSSQVVSVFPPLLARGVVALSIAQALPLGVVAVVGSRRAAARSSRAAQPQRVAHHHR